MLGDGCERKDKVTEEVSHDWKYCELAVEHCGLGRRMKLILLESASEFLKHPSVNHPSLKIFCLLCSVTNEVHPDWLCYLPWLWASGDLSSAHFC